MLDLIAAGMTNDQIAAEMGLSVATVESYVRSIYGKLGIKGRGEAGAYSERLRLELEGRVRNAAAGLTY